MYQLKEIYEMIINEIKRKIDFVKFDKDKMLFIANFVS